jgi:thiol-disulfide isomerase/thioredoxin
MEGGKKFWQEKQFFLGLTLGLVLVLIGALIFGAVSLYINENREIVAVNTNQIGVSSGPETETITNPAINTFEMKKGASICQEDGKPVIYLFTTSWCPHCQWVADTFNKVALEYEKAGKIKAYHFDLESGDNLLTTETESQLSPSAWAVYEEFSPDDAIPAFVFGCKYFRIGNGYENEDNLAEEEKEFRAIIEDLLK